MNEALKNRFVSFAIPYITGEQLAGLVDEYFPTIQATLKNSMLSLATDLRKQAENGLVSEEAASIRSLLDAIELAQYMSPIRAVRYAIAEKLDDASEKQLVIELAKTWME